MMLENVKSYFESNVESLERKLTHLSFEWTDKSDKDNDTEIDELKQYYKDDLLNKLEDKGGDILYYCNMYLDEWITKSVDRIHLLYLKRTKITDIMIQLKQLKLPEQRSKEWYEIREHLLTASSLADALGKGHFQTRDGLLISKTNVSDKKDTFSKASRDIMQWGVKYEPVATEFYEYLNKVKIVEFGLIPHPKLSVFGASPDGICDIGSPNGYEGRMLEIKCPPKRQFTHEVPQHYWMQMQGQLEVCDLEECDFLQVKIEEYSGVNEYESDCLVNDGLQGGQQSGLQGGQQSGIQGGQQSGIQGGQQSGIQHGKTKEDLPKGLVIAYTKKDALDNIEYKFSPWLASLDTILNWQKVILDELKDDYVIYEMKWWKITRYECTLVRRDKNWWVSVVPDIIQFWKDVVHYRKVGNEEVQKRINGRKRGPRKKVFEIKEPLKGYLMDSDDD